MPISTRSLSQEKRLALAEQVGHMLEGMSFVAVNCVADPHALYDAQVWFDAKDGSSISPEVKRRWDIAVIPREDVEPIYTDKDNRRLDDALRRMAAALGPSSKTPE